MNSLNIALLVNCVGFMVGIALYGLLAFMVFRHKRDAVPARVKNLLLTTAFLGLIWNLGELFLLIQKDLGLQTDRSFISAAAFSALGFLPTVVVHSVLGEQFKKRFVTLSAYSLSIIAAFLHFYNYSSGADVPSPNAQLVLSVGALFLIAALFLSGLKQTIGTKGIWATALLIFAGSSFHFLADNEGRSWLIEMIAHQSSLPLALAILYQNYRFAFADLFLKRAISLILLASVAFCLFIGVAAPLLKYHETHDRNDVIAISLILFLWIATALIYPTLHRLAVWLVDRVLLQRADYNELNKKISLQIDSLEKVDEIMDFVAKELGVVLTADRVKWDKFYDDTGALPENTESSAESAIVVVKTVELPYFHIILSEFQGGRRLLSEEASMLHAISNITARRIDGLRVTHERCDMEFREQKFATLAAEAQLTALRAQINPHFLFNALTTIGYLIQSSPEKAFQTLIHLTKLLRRVLNSTGEFCSLGDELLLIKSYLDIERARFEERLKVEFDIDEELKKVKIPVLILQPLVENAIKHGISKHRLGGTISISAKTIKTYENDLIQLCVYDTGAEKPTKVNDWQDGVGLSNIHGRLLKHYGNHSDLMFEYLNNGASVATIVIPIRAKGDLTSQRTL